MNPDLVALSQTRSPPPDLECWEVEGGDYLVFVFSLPGERTPDPLEALTVAEREVVTLVLDGHSNAEIARRRGCSRHTVANQLKSACRKLGVSGRIGLAQELAGLMAGPDDPPKK